MLLMIDNYDSFTYTLVQYFRALGQEVLVKRNDQITIEQIKQINPDHIVISPGPGTPEQAGLSKDIILQFYKNVPILGVCLGHQAIAQAFGATVIRAKKVMHGKTSNIIHSKTDIFIGIDNPFTVTRYHSLIVDENTLPEQIQATAWVCDENNKKQELMALKLKNYPVIGVQFHPESVLTQFGHKLLSNFLTY
ncbi:aminodeoxychorismate/anthranilate synthase component II [uncultured Psychrosphaera sp.]|uniref:anthranilate synthase component II n=1 Tax=uncultured Psychrosphaera sp. TaxID=1403522 RepID=UPI00262C3002|nr:aminodeoxychorismate/anthranilate synthase component II [uncultured Psychrosphaera sp.]